MKMTAEMTLTDVEMREIIRNGLGSVLSVDATISKIRTTGYPMEEYHITIKWSDEQTTEMEDKE